MIFPQEHLVFILALSLMRIKLRLVLWRQVFVFEVGGANEFEHGIAEKKLVLGSTALISLIPRILSRTPSRFLH
jgi:hypothetical protein